MVLADFRSDLRAGKDIEHEGEFARLCCGDEGAKKLLGLHHKRCKLLLKIQAAAFGKPCGAVAFGENARAFLGFLDRLGFVENLGGVMHPSCWQLIQCDIAARLAAGKLVPGNLDREKHFLGADVAFGAIIKHAGEALLKPVDYWANLWAGKAKELEAVKKAWMKAMRDKATARFIDLEKADFAAGGDGDWWVGYEKRYGPSRFFGVRMHDGRWRVKLILDGREAHIGLCDDEEDAARLANLLLVVMRREAPRNLTESFVEFLRTGGDGDVPADLVAAALLRVGDVRVNGVESDGGAEARDAASSLEKEIDEAIAADPEMQARAGMKLSDAGYDSGLGTWDKSLKTKWNKAQGRHMEAKGVKTVRDLALVDVFNSELAMELTLSGSYQNARLTLWRRKRAAAALLGVKELDPNKPPTKNRGRASKQERTPAHQRALDVASRWVAHAVTPDPAFVKDYADALAVIARRQPSKKSSGGDSVAESQKKKKRLR